MKTDRVRSSLGFAGNFVGMFLERGVDGFFDLLNGEAPGWRQIIGMQAYAAIHRPDLLGGLAGLPRGLFGGSHGGNMGFGGGRGKVDLVCPRLQQHNALR